MGEPSSLRCLVCRVQCAPPAQRVAELQERVATRLRAELPGRPPPLLKEALCSPCVDLLGDLDEHLEQVDRLRRKLKRRSAAGRRQAPCVLRAGRRNGGQAGSTTGKAVSFGEEGAEETAADSSDSAAEEGREEDLAVAEDPLGDVSAGPAPRQADGGTEQDGTVLAIRPDRDANVVADAEFPAEPHSDFYDDEEMEFLEAASQPDHRALLGLPSSPHPDSPDDQSAAVNGITDPGTVSLVRTEDNKEAIAPNVPAGTKLTGMHVKAKPIPRRRKRSKRDPAAAPRPPRPWTRVQGSSAYQCDVCSKQFQYLASMKIHAQTHTGEKPHECDLCGRRFALRTTLDNHRRLHTGDKPFKCKDCGRAFAQQSYLCVHRRVHSKDKPYCCEVCGKTFKQAYYMHIHARTHTGEKPYRCDDCDKGFTTVSNLYKHQRGHKGERQFCCEHCGKTFRDGSHLRDHRRSHTGERPFVCEYCGMRFALAKILARHIRMHTGEKPYTCMKCGKTFSRKESLRDHAKLHDSMPVPSPASAAAAAAMADGSASPAADDRYYTLDVMPVTSVEEALAWPLEVYSTETGVTVYKTLAEDGAALYQTETGEVFREMSGAEPQPPPPSSPPAAAVGGEHDEQLFDDPAPVPVVLPAYDRLGI